MIGFIIWIIGVVLCVKAVLEIMKWPVDGVKKLLVAIIILLTSWIGICVFSETLCMHTGIRSMEAKVIKSAPI